MKIYIEMTAEELNNGAELCTSIFPNLDISSYISADSKQIEAKCNAYEINSIIDPNTGIVSEMEIKTHFIMWMLRKMKPFITTFITLWNMFTDFVEDIQLMIGDVIVLHDGENLEEKYSNMIEEIDYFDSQSDESNKQPA